MACPAVARIALVKADKARAVENMILAAAQRGALGGEKVQGHAVGGAGRRKCGGMQWGRLAARRCRVMQRGALGDESAGACSGGAGRRESAGLRRSCAAHSVKKLALVVSKQEGYLILTSSPDHPLLAPNFEIYGNF
eukprot:14795-Chlamydomonas_euryale.AAC.1